MSKSTSQVGVGNSKIRYLLRGNDILNWIYSNGDVLMSYNFGNYISNFQIFFPIGCHK